MRHAVLVAGAALALAGAAAQARVDALPWEQAFPTAQAPARVWFKARYLDGQGAAHVLESWRDGRRFLHRRTDERVDLYLVARGPSGYRYRLVDHARRSVVDVDRNNLYRIGVFADWPVLAHVLDRPRMGQNIEAMSAPDAGAPAKCRWRSVAHGDVQELRDEVCWSSRWALPMVIRRAEAGHSPVEQFRVTELRLAKAGEFAAALPEPPAGYRYVDANRDIAPDSD